MHDERGHGSNEEDRVQERELEQKLVRVHKEEEHYEREIDRLQDEEIVIESELEDLRHRPKHHFSLIFIVNGEDVSVEADPGELLRSAVEKALAVSGNTGRMPTDWEVRDSAGVLLEMGRTIQDLGLADCARLFLSLKVGAGGNDETRS